MTARAREVDVATASDEQLVQEIVGRSAVAFEELYGRYEKRAFRLALALCGDPERAAEAVQSAFLAVWRSRGRCRSRRGTVAGWLLGVVRYNALDLLRLDLARGRRLPSDAPLPDADSLSRLLERLPQAQRDVIAMGFYGGLSHSEIAAELRLPPGVVKGRMRLGLELIRSEMKPSAPRSVSRAGELHE